MKTIFYKTSAFLFILLTSCAAFAQYDILYLGQADNPLDIALQEYLGLEGYTVTFVSEDDFKGATYETADGYTGYDALFVSESIGSSSANNYKAAGFPIPCVLTEGYAVRSDKLGFIPENTDTYFKQASSADLTADALTLVITDNEHWITQDYEPDYNLVWAETTDPTKLGVTACDLSAYIPDARPLGAFLFDMGTLSSLWAIPDGSMLNSTDALPNMVIIGVIQSSGQGHTFTGEFHELIVKCLRWVTDDYVAEGVNAPQHYNLIVGPNPTTGIVNVSLNLPAAGNVSLNVYDLAGKLMESTKSDYLGAGYNTIQLDFSGMPEAQYIFEIITGNDVLKGKIIKK